MKLINSTEWTDSFLRRMLAWTAKQVDYPVRKIREAKFRNRRSGAYSGHAYTSRRIVASIGPVHAFPVRPDHRPGMFGEIIADRVEALIAITAHELAHLHQYASGRIDKLRGTGAVESEARRREVAALRAFRVQREELLAKWSVTAPAPALSTPRPTVQELRADKAAKMLSVWTRKAKLAASKVKKYRKQVLYYNRQFTLAAAKPLSSSDGKTEP